MNILEVKNVYKYYGTQKAVDNVSFNIGAGEIVGFLGPNGAGKSTTMKMIAGLVAPDEGEIYIQGIRMTQDQIALRKTLAYLPEQNPLYNDLYVRESLEFMARLHNIPNAGKLIDDAIQVCGLSMEKHKKISMLSKGYKQRVGLAQSILHQPDLYILDEATTGLDPNQILDIRDLIRSLGKKHAVLISTHILQEVESICHRCILIHHGQIRANDSMSDFKNLLTRTPEVMVRFATRVVLRSLEDRWSKVIAIDENTYKIKDRDPLLTQSIYRWAVEHHMIIDELKRVEHKMEDIFQSLTENQS